MLDNRVAMNKISHLSGFRIESIAQRTKNAQAVIRFSALPSNNEVCRGKLYLYSQERNGAYFRFIFQRMTKNHIANHNGEHSYHFSSRNKSQKQALIREMIHLVKGTGYDFNAILSFKQNIRNLGACSYLGVCEGKCPKLLSFVH